jgi:hypothetical protein
LCLNNNIIICTIDTHILVLWTFQSFWLDIPHQWTMQCVYLQTQPKH